MPATELADGTFTSPPERADRMRDVVLSQVPADRDIRLLDIGCGTGSLLFRLADALPRATLVGIDISPANIRAARAQAAHGSARIQFEAADYLHYRAEPFDVLVSDGVMHLVHGETHDLVEKLAADLRPGGVLICNMPFECAYNRTFAVIRRTLRRVRSPWLDRAILLIGRILHGHEMDDERMRERVGYMYIAPERMMGPRLERAFRSAGLERRAGHAMKSTSPSQLKHRVTIFVRGAVSR